MALKKFDDNSSASYTKETTTDFSHLVDGLNPFRESMGGGNMLTDKGPLQLQGSDSEQSTDVALDPKKIAPTISLGSKNNG